MNQKDRKLLADLMQAIQLPGRLRTGTAGRLQEENDTLREAIGEIHMALLHIARNDDPNMEPLECIEDVRRTIQRL